MADNVQFTLNADSTPPNGTLAATDELADGSHAGIAKLAVSADGDRTLIPATVADGLLVDLGANNAVTVAGVSTAANQTTEIGHLAAIDADTGTIAGAVAGTEMQVDVVAALPAGNNNIGDVDIASLPNEGQQTMANSISVAIASNQSNVPVLDARASTATTTSVADSASSVTLLSANSARIKVIITNDSSARLYILFAASAASLTAYVLSLAQHESWEELNYTGEIRGIWATDPGDGAARITEFTV